MINDEEKDATEIFVDYLLQETNPCMRIFVNKKEKINNKPILNSVHKTDHSSSSSPSCPTLAGSMDETGPSSSISFNDINISNNKENTENNFNGGSDFILSVDTYDENFDDSTKSIINNNNSTNNTLPNTPTSTSTTSTSTNLNKTNNTNTPNPNINDYNTSNNNTNINTSNNTNINIRSAKEDLELRRQLKAHMRDQLEDLKVQTANKTSYAKRLIEAMLISEERSLKSQEKKASCLVMKYKNKIDDENRVNAEVESFLRASIKQDEELLKKVNDDYEHNLKDREKTYEDLMSKKNIQKQSFTELKKLYFEYEKVVVEYRIEKEKKRKEEEIKMAKFKAVIKVQRWWRNYVARKKQKEKKDKKKVKRSSRGRK